MILRMYLVPFFVCTMILIYDCFLHYSSESKKIYTNGFNGREVTVKIIFTILPYINVFFASYLFVSKLLNITHKISEYIKSSTNNCFIKKVDKLFDNYINPKIFKNFKK